MGGGLRLHLTQGLCELHLLAVAKVRLQPAAGGLAYGRLSN